MKPDIQLSPHFCLSEFTRSATAAAHGIDNTPSLEVVARLQQLCIHVLEPLRTYANASSATSADKAAIIPVIISSGYRSPALDKIVGKAAASQHTTGEACDIHTPDEATGQRWFAWMKHNLSFDQLIWERSTPTSTRHWIHVSFRASGLQRQRIIEELVKNGNQ